MPSCVRCPAAPANFLRAAVSRNERRDGGVNMYAELITLLRGMKPANILLLQACIVISCLPAVAALLGKWFPLGVVRSSAACCWAPRCSAPLRLSLPGAVRSGQTGRSCQSPTASPRLRQSPSACSAFLPAPTPTRAHHQVRPQYRRHRIAGMLMGWLLGIAGRALIYAAFPSRSARVPDCSRFHCLRSSLRFRRCRYCADPARTRSHAKPRRCLHSRPQVWPTP